jgi:hypothetical protein
VILWSAIPAPTPAVSTEISFLLSQGQGGLPRAMTQLDFNPVRLVDV